MLEVPFIFASNGDGFIFHDKTKLGTSDAHNLESEIRLEDFPSPQELWAKYCAWKGYTDKQLPIINQDTMTMVAVSIFVIINCKLSIKP